MPRWSFRTRLLLYALELKAYIFQAFICKRTPCDLYFTFFSLLQFYCLVIYSRIGRSNDLFTSNFSRLLGIYVEWITEYSYSILFIYRVVCKCGSCGPERKALSEWERHTGSKAKNWRTSVKVKSSKLPLEEWVCTNLLIFALVIWSLYFLICHIDYRKSNCHIPLLVRWWN